MQRPLVIHGLSEAPGRDLARRLAAFAPPGLDRPERGLATEEGLRRALAEPPARPLVTTSDVLARREFRLEVLERAIVVALAEDAATPEAHVAVPEAAAGDDTTVERVAELWRRDPIVVAAGDRTYLVEVAADVLPARARELIGAAPVAVLVTDENVEPLHAAKVTGPVAGTSVRLLGHVMKPGEKSKIVRTVVQLWNVALESGADRGSVFLGLGGGVVTDVTGFAAATWMRGVRWVALPTTLLAMVDASVGGKTGVDLRAAKNAVGAFWQPSAVVCDVATLATEPARGFVSALGEVIKTALIGDPALLTLLEGETPRVLAREPDLLLEVVKRCVTVKARVVGLDERESGLRAVLNLGHTVGHALEAQSNYTLAHGEAVSLGLVAACRIGERLGVTAPDLSARVIELLHRVGLPTRLGDHDLEAASALIGHDKKRAGSRIKFVVVEGPGAVRAIPVELEELRGLTRTLA